MTIKVVSFENSYLVSVYTYNAKIKDNILKPKLGRPEELFISQRRRGYSYKFY